MLSLKELKIVIADDSKLISDALRRTLSKVNGLRVVGQAENGIRALELVREHNPHVLVLDISMPFKNGIDVLEELRAENSTVVVVMFTADSSAFAKKACLDLGANYYLDKSQISELTEICFLHLLAL
ncbi:MAG TPA: response regulator transcription factor [Pyrinomonadaceae bacterium]|nr:response regulator transcription factor [Pyrinomonadaceae bacterium]